MIELVVENVKSKLVFDHELPTTVVNEINHKLSYEILGARFVKNNFWSGRVYLFKKQGGVFPTGLIHYVREILHKHSIKYKLVDQRIPPSCGFPIKILAPEQGGFILRPFQKEIVDLAVKKQRGVIQAATGAGKTNIFISLVATLNVPTLILIHKTDVFLQIINRLEKALGTSVGRIGDGIFDPKRITVAMIQSLDDAWTLTRRKKQKDADGRVSEIVVPNSQEVLQKKQKIRDYIGSVECIITDEAHHIPSDSFVTVHKHAQNAFYRYGMSASPWREDNTDLLIEAYNGAIMKRISASSLIEQGYLTKPLIQLLSFEHERKTRSGMKYAEIYDESIVLNEQRNKVIIETAIRAVSQGKTVLIAITKVAHGQLLEGMLKTIEPSTIFVHGESNSTIRETVLEELNQKQRKIVICTTIFGEGVDCPNLDVLINAKAAASSIDALQLAGRVLRKTSTKTHAYIVDILDKRCKYIESHSTARKKIYDSEELFIKKHVSSCQDLIFQNSRW